MPRIVTIETTVMLNILGIPGFDQNRVAALDRLEKLLARIIHERILTGLRMKNLAHCTSSNWVDSAAFRVQACPRHP